MSSGTVPQFSTLAEPTAPDLWVILNIGSSEAPPLESFDQCSKDYHLEIVEHFVSNLL